MSAAWRIYIASSVGYHPFGMAYHVVTLTRCPLTRMVSLGMPWRTIHLVDESCQYVLINLGRTLHYIKTLRYTTGPSRRPILIETSQAFSGPKSTCTCLWLLLLRVLMSVIEREH